MNLERSQPPADRRSPFGRELGTSGRQTGSTRGETSLRGDDRFGPVERMGAPLADNASREDERTAKGLARSGFGEPKGSPPARTQRPKGEKCP